jgi:hypothetical protein
MPDRRTQVMRRRPQRRNQLIWGRSKAKNQIHAVLMRQPIGRPPFSDLFGKRGRRWLAELELQVEERESVDSALGQIEFLDSEVEAVERPIATDALDSPEIKRLMTVPGVNVICAAAFIAAIGEVRRFEGLASWAATSGSIRASGGRAPPREPRADLEAGLGGRPPRAGGGRLVGRPPAGSDPRPLPARSLAARPPGRGHRRGAQACLPVLVPAHPGGGLCLRAAVADSEEAPPARDPRRLEGQKGIYTGTFVTRQRMRAAERELAEQAEAAYKRSVRDRQATQTKRKGAGATPGRASRGPSSGQAARQVQAPGPAL